MISEWQNGKKIGLKGFFLSFVLGVKIKGGLTRTNARYDTLLNNADR